MENHTAATRSCKSCGDEYRVTEEQIARAVASLRSDPGRCVPDEVYRQRLAVCGCCTRLESGVTCSVCGCIVQVAALLRERRCPMPGGGLWAPLQSSER